MKSTVHQYRNGGRPQPQGKPQHHDDSARGFRAYSYYLGRKGKFAAMADLKYGSQNDHTLGSESSFHRPPILSGCAGATGSRSINRRDIDGS